MILQMLFVSFPRKANLLLDFVPDTQVYHVARAIKTMFDKHGNRRSKFSNRIKFLWRKLQREEFVSLFTQMLITTLPMTEPSSSD